MVNYPKIMLTALAPAIAICASAQVTTSAMSGRVVDEAQQPVIGAAVVAVHTPSGTRYTAVTNNDGRYTLQGMRTGGPYTVTISYLGYGKKAYEKLYLELGNTLPLNAQLSPVDTELGEAVVVASARQRGGGARNYSLDKITSTPTIDRNVYDIVKNTPMAMSSKNGGITIAGTNNRYNSFQIDGTVANDVFGLSAGGTNGAQTSANPISMDAIQEIQVVVAPYDVRQGGFTGGGINAITKQGTNETFGSAYTYFNNQNMYGKHSAVQGYAKSPLQQQYSRTYGGTLGGAIVKDKLFYFVSAEGHKESYPSQYYPGYTSSYVTADAAQQIADRYYDLTGIRESYGQRDIERKSFGLLARLDWNINDKHKLALRYQHNNSYSDSYGSGSSEYFFVNSGYRYNNKTNALVAELNSQFTENIFNELRGSATFVRDHREIPYAGPSIAISNVYGADGTSRNDVNIGTEYSSGANSLDQDIYSIEDNLSWYLGDHTLTFGTHNEFYRIKNLFLQGAYGEWSFNSLDDFLNDNPWRFRYAYTDPDLTGSLQYAPSLKAGQFGFYVQDKWVPTNNFNLTYGLRFDIPLIFNDPMENPEFNTFAAAQGFGVRVGETPSAKVMVSPRVGFNWYTDDSHRTLLRGGVGIFTGRVPFVWLSNAFNNTGMDVKKVTIQNSNVPSLEQYKDNPLGAAQSGTAGSSDIVTVAKDFKYPQVLRANLALEQMLPGDVKMTIEGIYSKTLNNVFFENLALTNNGEKIYAVPGVEASSAPYYSLLSSNYNSIINLKNTNEGYSYALSAMLEKSFDFGLDLMASYTFGHSKSVNDGTSSVAYSNWQYNYSRDTNGSGELGFSKFDVPHRVMVQASYTSPRYWNDWMSTTVSVIYNGFSGGRYSLSMYESQDFNGDGARGNSLLYIPTDEELNRMEFVDVVRNGQVTMTAEEGREAFRQWILNDSYAKDHRGQYAERNSNHTAWEHEINLHLAQTIYNPKGLGKLEFTFDIINFANMLNKKWGATYGNVYNLSPLAVQSVTAGADGNMTATYTYNTNSYPQKSDVNSRWHCQVGIRLTF